MRCGSIGYVKEQKSEGIHREDFGGTSANQHLKSIRSKE